MWDAQDFVISVCGRSESRSCVGRLRNWIFFNCVTCRRRHPLRVHCLVVITELGDCYDGGSRPKTIIKDVYPRKVDFRHEPALETLR
jgi:hypothetical protein